MNGWKLFCLACIAFPSISCNSGQGTGKVTGQGKAIKRTERVIPVASIRVREFINGFKYPEYNNSSDIPLAFDGHRCKIDETPGPYPDSFYLRITTDLSNSTNLLLLIFPKTDGSIEVHVVHKQERWPYYDLIGPNGEVLVEDFEPGPRQQYTFPKGAKVTSAK